MSNENIFGYNWKTIQAMQQGEHVRETVDMTKSEKPLATKSDIELFNNNGIEWLEKNQMFGIIDKLKNSNVI